MRGKCYTSAPLRAIQPEPLPVRSTVTPLVATLTALAVSQEHKAASFRRKGYLTASALAEGKACGFRHAIDLLEGAAHASGAEGREAAN